MAQAIKTRTTTRVETTKVQTTKAQTTNIASHAPVSPVVQNRYEAVVLWDVKDSNPNGDPNDGGRPRADPLTGRGLITDVCIKRCIRDYVEKTAQQNIYVQRGSILAETQEAAYAAVGLNAPPPEEPEEVEEQEEQVSTSKSKKAPPKEQADPEAIKIVRDWMAKTYFDVRGMGIVYAGVGKKALGSVTGPLQVSFATSVEPIYILDHCITRVAVATKRESLANGGRNQTMGRKSTVSYGLYAGKIFINPSLAERTGFTEADLALVWEALDLMWDHCRSASRGYVAMRKLVIFRHASKLGNASARSLFDRVTVKRKTGCAMATSYDDYDVTVNLDNLPQGIEVRCLP